MRIPEVAPAFTIPEPALTTFKLSAYCRKFVAVKNVSKLLEFGLPNTCTSCSSEVIVVTEETGPF